MSGFLFDPSIAGVHRVMDLRQQQHTMTASNIANDQTPHYKAKFLDFSNALQDAMQADAAEIEADVIELDAPGWATDGNSVRLEKEHARLRSNAVIYQGLVQGMSRRLALLKFAAADGRA